jgi:hypothetical protein
LKYNFARPKIPIAFYIMQRFLNHKITGPYCTVQLGSNLKSIKVKVGSLRLTNFDKRVYSSTEEKYLYPSTLCSVNIGQGDSGKRRSMYEGEL